MKNNGLARTLFAASLATTLGAPVCAGLTSEELAKLAQNPVGNLISVPGKDGTSDTVFTAFLSPAKPGHWGRSARKSS